MIKDTITFPDFVKLDVRIGTIKEAEMVEGSERLIKMKVDLGKEVGVRQIVAGLGLSYKSEDLVGKQVPVVVNLAPKKMMNLESEGMIMAAGDEEVVLFKPEKKLAPGTVVR